MAHLFGILATRSDLVPGLVAAVAPLFRVERGATSSAPASRPSAPPAPLGWGIGFRQANDVLLRRRPLDDREVVDLGEPLAALRADLVVAHVREASVGAPRSENTHPFRHRHWLFAHGGTLPGGETLRDALLAQAPSFLRSVVRGDTDSEALFALVLGGLHGAGLLEDEAPAVERVAAVLRATLAEVDSAARRLAPTAAPPSTTSELMLASAEHLWVHAGRGATAYRSWAGRDQVGAILPAEVARRAAPAVLDEARATLVASHLAELPAGFTPVERGGLLVVSRREAPAELAR